jgi:hypothetical protein
MRGFEARRAPERLRIAPDDSVMRGAGDAVPPPQGIGARISLPFVLHAKRDTVSSRR